MLCSWLLTLFLPQGPGSQLERHRPHLGDATHPATLSRSHLMPVAYVFLFSKRSRRTLSTSEACKHSTNLALPHHPSRLQTPENLNTCHNAHVMVFDYPESLFIRIPGSILRPHFRRFGKLAHIRRFRVCLVYSCFLCMPRAKRCKCAYALD